MINTVLFHFYEIPGIVKFIEAESRIVVVWSWERGKWGVIV